MPGILPPGKYQYVVAGRRRTFTNVQKKEIILEAGERGVNRVLREYKISYSVFARWKQQNLSEPALLNLQLQQQMEELLGENQRLKKIVANLVLDLEKKNEELGIKTRNVL